eukprot:11165737-Lingulodinium_polyedra.AAC.1
MALDGENQDGGGCGPAGQDNARAEAQNADAAQTGAARQMAARKQTTIWGVFAARDCATDEEMTRQLTA